MKRWIAGWLITLGLIYCFLAFGLPYLVTPRSGEIVDDQITRVTSLGRFKYGVMGEVHYELWSSGSELVYEINPAQFILCKGSILVWTERENGIFIIRRVLVGNRSYEKTLRDHPEVLTEAEEILKIGRDGFAKAKKKLEHKFNRNQPGRLG